MTDDHTQITGLEFDLITGLEGNREPMQSRVDNGPKGWAEMLSGKLTANGIENRVENGTVTVLYESRHFGAAQKKEVVYGKFEKYALIFTELHLKQNDLSLDVLAEKLAAPGVVDTVCKDAFRFEIYEFSHSKGGYSGGVLEMDAFSVAQSADPAADIYRIMHPVKSALADMKNRLGEFLDNCTAPYNHP